MRVDKVGIVKISELYSKNKKIEDVKKNTTVNDRVEISNTAKSLTAYALDNKYEASQERLEKIKSQIQNGTYRKDAKVIAQKIVEEFK